MSAAVERMPPTEEPLAPEINFRIQRLNFSQAGSKRRSNIYVPAWLKRTQGRIDLETVASRQPTELVIFRYQSA